MNLVNELTLYFGEDYVINDYITLHSPTIKDVLKMGESAYYGVVTAFSAIPSDMKVHLWDLGICWEDVSDFEFFASLVVGIPVESTEVFFGDLDFRKFSLYTSKENGEPVLYQALENGDEVIIDKLIHMQIARAIRLMHGINPKIEKAGSKIVRQILIDEDRRRIESKKNEKTESMLLPLVSSLVNCQESSYKIADIKDMPLYAFMDSVSRVQIVRNATALLQGCYSGMIDTSKIDKKQLNWMKKLT